MTTIALLVLRTGELKIALPGQRSRSKITVKKLSFTVGAPDKNIKFYIKFEYCIQVQPVLVKQNGNFSFLCKEMDIFLGKVNIVRKVTSAPAFLA